VTACRTRQGADGAEARQLGTRDAGARRRVCVVVMQRGGSVWTPTEGAVEPRMVDVRGRRGEGSGRAVIAR
jgi:hypothetical protein